MSQGTEVGFGSSRSAIRQLRWKISLSRETGPDDSRGQSATFIVFQTPEEGIGIPVDLTGFSAGFDALPR